jgi:integrase
MTPHRNKKRIDGKLVPVGTLVFDRVFRGIGRIALASGQPDTVDGRRRFKQMNQMLTDLYQNGDGEILARFKAGEIAPLQLFAAWKGKRLDKLPTVEMMQPLAATFTAWAKAAPTGPHNKAQRLTAGRTLERLASGAMVGEIARVVGTYQRQCMTKGTPSAFNHFKVHCQRFIGLTLGEHHPIYTQLTRIESLKVTVKRKRGLTLLEATAVWTFLKEPYRRAFRELCYTGMRPNEYFAQRWQVLNDRIEVYGTKTQGADRAIPLVQPIIGAGITRQRLRYALEKYPEMTVEPYTARRTFMHWMEEAGIPRARRKMYMGHGVKDVSDLYERSHHTAYLKEDAAKLRVFLGVAGVQLMSARR